MWWHAQKPDFVFRRNGRVHLNRRGRQFSRILAAEVLRISGSNGSNAGYTMFRGSVKSTGYPLHLPVYPSLPLPCVTMCHHISSGLYQRSCGMCCLHIQGTETLGFSRMFVSTSLHEVIALMTRIWVKLLLQAILKFPMMCLSTL